MGWTHILPHTPLSNVFTTFILSLRNFYAFCCHYLVSLNSFFRLVFSSQYSEHEYQNSIRVGRTVGMESFDEIGQKNASDISIDPRSYGEEWKGV